MITSDQRIDTSILGKSITRRSLTKSIVGIGAAAVVGSTLGPVGASAALAQYKTTARVNLRAGAGTSHAVITVIPAGAIVAYQGRSANNFMEVGYGHTYGWVHKDYLVPTSGIGNPELIGTAKTTANVNLRNGPSTGNQIVRVVPAGTTVQISGTVQNGFRFVIDNGQGGWIADQFLRSNVPGDGPYDPNVATTTARLNLRAEPSPTAKVLLVMPEGARVRVLKGGSGQFRKVSYNGTTGWAAYVYLS